MSTFSFFAGAGGCGDWASLDLTATAPAARAPAANCVDFSRNFRRVGKSYLLVELNLQRTSPENKKPGQPGRRHFYPAKDWHLPSC